MTRRVSAAAAGCALAIALHDLASRRGRTGDDHRLGHGVSRRRPSGLSARRQPVRRARLHAAARSRSRHARPVGRGLVRVWAHWLEPIYQGDGSAHRRRTDAAARAHRAAARARHSAGARAAAARVSFPGQGVAIFASAEARVRAVQAITTALRDYRNVIFDLYNEHDHPGGPISHADSRVLRDAVKAIDSARLVTISSTGGHLVSAASQVGPGRGAEPAGGSRHRPWRGRRRHRRAALSTVAMIGPPPPARESPR